MIYVEGRMNLKTSWNIFKFASEKSEKTELQNQIKQGKKNQPDWVFWKCIKILWNNWILISKPKNGLVLDRVKHVYTFYYQALFS